MESKRRPVAGRDVRAGDGDPIAGCLRAEPQLTVAVAVDFASVVAAAMRRPAAVAIRRVRVAVVHSRIRTRNHLAVGVGRDAEVVGGMQLPRLDKDVVRQRVLLPGDGGDRLADLGEAAACAAASLSLRLRNKTQKGAAALTVADSQHAGTPRHINDREVGVVGLPPDNAGGAGRGGAVDGPVEVAVD